LHSVENGALARWQ